MEWAEAVGRHRSFSVCIEAGLAINGNTTNAVSRYRDVATADAIVQQTFAPNGMCALEAIGAELFGLRHHTVPTGIVQTVKRETLS